MRASKFLDSLSSKLAEKWLANLLTPSFIFWIGGVTANIEKFDLQRIQNLTEVQQIILLVLFLLIVTTSAFIIGRLDYVTLRFLEGYWPRFLGPLCRWRSSQKRTIKEKIEAECQSLHIKQDTQGLAPDEKNKLVQLELQLQQMPDSLMPTRLGNRLRSAEEQPFIKHGLDTVRCWPYLWLILPQHIRSDLLETRNDLNTAARMCLWSLLFCLWGFWGTLWPISLGLLSSLFSYRWALESASAYGDLLQAAFTLHRFDLYLAMKWPLPPDPDSEKKIAEQLNTYLARGYHPQDFTYSLPDSDK